MTTCFYFSFPQHEFKLLPLRKSHYNPPIPYAMTALAFFFSRVTIITRHTKNRSFLLWCLNTFFFLTWVVKIFVSKVFFCKSAENFCSGRRSVTLRRKLRVKMRQFTRHTWRSLMLVWCSLMLMVWWSLLLGCNFLDWWSFIRIVNAVVRETENRSVTKVIIETKKSQLFSR